MEAAMVDNTDISIKNNNAKVVVQYGLAQAAGIVVFIAICLAIGIVANKMTEAFVFVPAMYSLRIFVGGYHANTKGRCFILSILFVILAFLFMDVAAFSTVITWASVCISYVAIWLFAPVQNAKKPLSIKEHEMYKKFSRIIASFWMAIFVVACLIGWNSVRNSIAATFSVIFFVMMTGVIKYYFRECSSNSGTDNTTRYTYNNTTWNLDSMTDQYGTTTEYTYDTEGNLTRQDFDLYTVDQNVSGDITNVKVGDQNLAAYSYDALGKLSTKAYGNGQSISYTYTGDNIATISYGTTLAYEFTYKSDGTLDTKVDHINNTTTEYTNDEVNVHQGTLSGDIIYSYANENGYETNGAAVTTLTEQSGTDTYITKNYDTYDVFGKENGTTSLYKTYTKTDGRIDSTSVNLNSQNGTNLLTTNFTYTGDNVTQVANTIGSVSKNFTYEYDSEDRISKVSCGSDDVNYYYDSKDQLIRTNNEILGKTFTYTYNSRGNLTSKATYDYTTADPISGNPISTDTYAYTDSNWPDKLTSYNGEDITYDAIGNPLSYKGYTMTWTAGRMLDSMIGNDKTLYFKYNDEGIRTQKTVNGTVTKYTTIDGRITSQKDGTNSLYFHYDQNSELTGVMINGTEYLYVRNLQGDIVSMVDTSGNVVVNYTYDAWGKVESITGSLASTIGAINPMRYRGYYMDVETGLYYLQSRYYDPDTCRMVNADEPDMMQMVATDYIGNNMFAYCSNNPIMYTDPTGKYKYSLRDFYRKNKFVATIIDVIIGLMLGGVASKIGSYFSKMVVKYGKERARIFLSKELGRKATRNKWLARFAGWLTKATYAVALVIATYLSPGTAIVRWLDSRDKHPHSGYIDL